MASSYYKFSIQPNPEFGTAFYRALSKQKPFSDTVVDKMFLNVKKTEMDKALERFLRTVLEQAYYPPAISQASVTFELGVPGLASKRNSPEYANEVCQFVRDCGVHGFTFFKVNKTESPIKFYGEDPNECVQRFVNSNVKPTVDQNIERNNA
ncbi:hypothetical protein [Edwardsiella phage PEi26]|uniref:Uncharacterized protein n=1 Tax=Edwardsiella phage PEi26 TaxID=1608311 RepID=A0A0B6VLL4_9CAUD|nr:hypothetical protein [Edwardsiella phage PEi26]